MSSCLSGGSRAIRIDLDIVKSPSSTSTITSHSTSPSSTLSESSNSPLAISTRKPRTPRKRPNQTYHEAAALLSTAYPNIFSTKNLTKPCKFTKPHQTFLDHGPELLLPFRVFDNSGFLLHHPIPEKPNFRIDQRVGKPCRRPEEGEFQVNSLNLWNGYQEDFDAESILDEEIEEGIDSIIGNVEVTNDGSIDESSNFGATSIYNSAQFSTSTTCYGHPVGLGFGVKLESCLGSTRRGFRSRDCWRFPTVDMSEILPKLNKVTPEKRKKKTEKLVEVKSLLEATKDDSSPTKQVQESSVPKPEQHGLLLKLNYDSVASAWSDRGTPFSGDDIPGQEMSTTGSDLHARLAQIDLFSENGGLREASVLRYKEKRRTRLFSKKIRYQVRKVNADQRPRMKGRFVRRPNSPMSESRQD